MVTSAQHLNSDKILKLEPHPNKQEKFIAKFYSKYTRKLIEYWEMTGDAAEINGNNFNQLRSEHKIIPDGKHYRFYPNSTKYMFELNYKKGERKGIFIGYYKSGEVRFKGKIGDPRIEKLTHYYKSGEVKEIENFRLGIKWGKQIQYYPNGNKKSISDYQNGTKDRKYYFYYPNGQLKRQLKIEWDEKVSEKCFDENGNQINCSPITEGPKYPGGIDSLKAMIEKINFDFNVDENDTLTCLIAFEIDSTGISDIHDFNFRNNDAFYKTLADWINWLPTFIPAQKENHPTNCMVYIVFPVFQNQVIWSGDLTSTNKTNRYFEKQEEIETYSWDFPIPAKGDIYFIAEEMPKFPGGEHALRRYITNQIKYPKVARRKGIQGKVYVNFVIDTDGSVSDVQVYKSVDPLLDSEAIRIVNSMPNWKPGKQKGKPVSVSYTVPINFELERKASKYSIETNSTEL